MHDPIRVLQITVGGTAFTGITSFLLQYYKKMNHDIVHFDFLFCRENSMSLYKNESTLENSLMFEIKAIKANSKMDYMLLSQQLQLILEKHHYDVVHINTSSITVNALCVYASKKAGVETIIAHSHNSYMAHNTLTENNDNYSSYLRKCILSVLRKYVKMKSDYLFACSIEAGEFLFGKGISANKKFKIIRNAIDTEKFHFDENKRKEIRGKTNINADCLVFGLVGRFSILKNHDYLLELFDSIYEINKNVSLWLIGDGEERDRIEKKAKILACSNNIVFWGQRNDIDSLLQGMDVFIMPSFHEGFPIVAVEAQSTGLETFLSDSITKEALLTPYCHFFSIKERPEVTARTVLHVMTNKRNRINMSQVINEKGYGLDKAASELTTFYSTCKEKE